MNRAARILLICRSAYRNGATSGREVLEQHLNVRSEQITTGDQAAATHGNQNQNDDDDNRYLAGFFIFHLVSPPLEQVFGLGAFGTS